MSLEEVETVFDGSEKIEAMDCKREEVESPLVNYSLVTIITPYTIFC